MGKNAGHNIAESADADKTASADPAPPPEPARQDFRAVRLTKDGRYFFCPHCKRHHPHPPLDLEFYMIGYGFCWLRCDWMPIEGGDACGIVRADERGRLHTVEHGARRR